MSAVMSSARPHLAALLDRFGVKTAVVRARRRRGEFRLSRRTAARLGAAARARAGAVLIAPIPDARTRRALERAAGRRMDVAGTDAEDARVTLLVDPLRIARLPERFTAVIVDPRLGPLAAAVAGAAAGGTLLLVQGTPRSRRRGPS